MKTVTIVTTGSEITSGQILNTNATWISQRLIEFNFEIRKHISISDDKDLILDTLKTCSQDSDLVIVTGGLGPTTDDLTRQIVAEWLNQPLILNTDEWTRILGRLDRLEVKPRDGHKWQAHFPKDSEIFVNHAGTASGFSVQSTYGNNKCLFWFLPGPPYEIHRIWSDHLQSKLSMMGPQKKTQLLSWHFLDVPESEIANFVEDKFKDSDYAIGYRASPPLVELKIWVPENFDFSKDSRFLDLESHFSKELHFKNKNDPTLLFLKSISSKHFYIKDEVTSGDLLFRLKNVKENNFSDIGDLNFVYATTEFKDIEYPYLQINKKTETDYGYIFQDNDLTLKMSFSITKKISTLRRNNWICEIVFKSLCQHFRIQTS